MADTPQGETVTPGAPLNSTAQASVPAQDNASNPEVERLRKELEQAQMRSNQLQNQLEKEQQTKAEAQRKELEEKEQYRQLYESEKAEAERLRQEREAEERSQALTAASEEVFKDYPANVVEAAKIAGLSLTDDSESARGSLKEKLDALQNTVGTQTPVQSSNPVETVPEAGNAEEWTARNSEGYSKLGIELAKGNDQAFKEYAKAHPQIQRVKERMIKLATEGQ